MNQNMCDSGKRLTCSVFFKECALTTTLADDPCRGCSMATKVFAGCLALSLLGCLLDPAVASGDGCVIARQGKYVAEKEQRAYIEWEDGQERLYVATRTEASTDATLWILPVPAKPRHVQAEPVEQFPHVSYTEP